MLTASDIKKLMQVFATKADLEELVTKSEFHQTMDDVIEKLDAVYGEVKLRREDQIVHAEVHRNLKEKIDDVKVRDDRLEQAA